jgi:hypothetical protein
MSEDTDTLQVRKCHDGKAVLTRGIQRTPRGRSRWYSAESDGRRPTTAAGKSTESKNVTFGFSPNIPLQESLVAYKIPSQISACAVFSRAFDKNIHSRFFFLIFSSTCLCGPFRSSEPNLLPGVRDLLIRKNPVDGVLYRLRVENLSAPFQLRLARILVPTLRPVTQSTSNFPRHFPCPRVR